MATDVNKSILDALEAGYGPQDIIEHLKSSEDPAHQEWYNTYSTNMQTRANEQPAQQAAPKSNTGILNAIDQADPLTLGLGAAGAYAISQGPKLYNAAQERKLDREKLAIENRRITAYEQQVGKQGVTPEMPMSAPAVQQAPTLTPLEEARLNTERARAEAIQAKIAMEERKVAALELKAKADAEARAAKAAAGDVQKTTASGAVNPEDRQMLQSSEKAKMDKAITAEQKAASASIPQAVQPPAVQAPTVAAPEVAPTNVGIAPPKTSEITLTPSPEVKAETVPVAAAPETKPAGSVPPKAKEQKTFKKIEELPKEMQFKAGVGGGDSWLHDTVGPDIRKFIIDEFNGGKPIGGGQAGMDKAYGLVGKYEQWLKENIPEQTLTRSERKFAGIPPAKQYGPLGKAVKVGGAAGLLMTAAQAANAREAIGNVAEALLPLGLTPSSLASGELTPEIRAAQDRQMKEMQKLGSPYRSVPPPKR
jgi:hypothetical protein